MVGDRELRHAAQVLAAGGLVAFPTETVYGLGARADRDDAVAQVFAAKGRPHDHPLIVHVASLEAAAFFAAQLPDPARALMQRFWPGALTVIVPRRAGRGAAAAGGQATIGLRMPSHPLALALLREAAALGVIGVAAPSANRFGRVSPTTAAHVRAEFGPDLLVLDGGPCALGVESTIVDCTGDPPALLRPGGTQRARIEEVLGVALAERRADSPRASGTLEVHYAPAARLRLMSAERLAAALAARPAAPGALGVYSRTISPPAGGVLFRVQPADATLAARELFAVLREFDAAGVQQLWVEEPPAAPEWDAVRDRLRRAAAA